MMRLNAVRRNHSLCNSILKGCAKPASSALGELPAWLSSQACHALTGSLSGKVGSDVEVENTVLMKSGGENA